MQKLRSIVGGLFLLSLLTGSTPGHADPTGKLYIVPNDPAIRARIDAAQEIKVNYLRYENAGANNQRPLFIFVVNESAAAFENLVPAANRISASAFVTEWLATAESIIGYSRETALNDLRGQPIENSRGIWRSSAGNLESIGIDRLPGKIPYSRLDGDVFFHQFILALPSLSGEELAIVDKKVAELTRLAIEAAQEQTRVAGRPIGNTFIDSFLKALMYPVGQGEAATREYIRHSLFLSLGRVQRLTENPPVDRRALADLFDHLAVYDSDLLDLFLLTDPPARAADPLIEARLKRKFVAARDGVKATICSRSIAQPIGRFAL